MRISKLVNISSVTEQQVQPKPLPHMALQNPAYDVLKEVGEDKGLKLRAGLGIDLARTILVETNRLTAIVVDRQQRVVGFISLADLESVKVLATAARLGLLRNELVLQDLMTPVKVLSSISPASSARVSVGEIIQTLQKLSKPYLLVIDSEDGGLVGYFSAQDISHKLGVSVAIDQRPSTFNEVVDVVGHPH